MEPKERDGNFNERGHTREKGLGERGKNHMEMIYLV